MGKVRPAEIWLILVGVAVIAWWTSRWVFAAEWTSGTVGLYFGSLRVFPWWPSRCCGGARRHGDSTGLTSKAFRKCKRCQDGMKLRWGVRVFMPGLAAKELGQ